MPASRIDEITDTEIANRLTWASGATVEWTGRMPRDAERWGDLAAEKLAGLEVADVRAALERSDLVGDDASGEIDMAISLAAEPADLPDNAMVSLIG